MNLSKVSLYGYYSKDECGYCKIGPGSSYGLNSEYLFASDYDALMNRGFRRSGKFLYKPTMYEVLMQTIVIYFLYFSRLAARNTLSD
jgi:arginyl-tRNA--protein-N-Asp/Glu arginylyltransferase